MKITAAICTFNRNRYLNQLFQSIVKQTLSPSDFEIILVNNNSTDETKATCENFQKNFPFIHFRYFDEHQQGLSFARNRCIKEANSPYITFLDDDAFIANDYLEKIVGYLDDHPSVSAIGSKIHLHYETIKPKWENKFVNPILGYYDLGEQQKRMYFPEYPRGSNMSFRMDVFEIIGDFNVELGRIGGKMLGGEEKDLFARIYKNDALIVLYVPDALVYHCVPESRTTNQFVKNQAIGIGSSEKMRLKQAGAASLIVGFVKELAKWAASMLIALAYLTLGKVKKAAMILKFRYWVSAGMFRANDSVDT